MAIEVGKIAIVKTTEEPVFVLAVEKATPLAGLGSYYHVRRPVATTEDGILHINDKFYEAELESKEDVEKRMLARMGMLKGLQGRDTTTDALDDKVLTVTGGKLN